LQEHDDAAEAEIYYRNKASRSFAKVRDGNGAASSRETEEAKKRLLDCEQMKSVPGAASPREAGEVKKKRSADCEHIRRVTLAASAGETEEATEKRLLECEQMKCV
jgi:hypothetical protein